MKIKNNIIIITIIMFITVILRLWNLGSNPPHLSPDEASLGYNAYSILKTGRDLHGELLPVVTKAFGDYTPALYSYIAIPFIILFGLNEWTVRLPSAIAGVLAVWLLYLVIRNLRIGNYFGFRNSNLEFLAAALLAASPWHIILSRGAWVPNLSLTLTLAGILFFLKGLKFPKHLIYSSFFFAMTLWAYQGAKITTFLTLIILLAVFGKQLIKFPKKTLLWSLLVGVFLTLPIIFSIYQGRVSRLEIISIFSYPRTKEDLKGILDQGKEAADGLSYYLYHSEGLSFGRAILGRYFNHFSARFLFFEGDWENPRHNAPNMGMLLLFDILLLPIGLICLIRLKSRIKYFVLFWLVFSPIPAIFTRDQVHAVRSLHMLIPLTIISSLGLSYFLSVVKKPIYYIPYTIFFLSSVIYFLDSYFVHMPIHNAKYWNCGYKQAAEKLIPIKNNYKNIVIRQSYDQPYIYLLFYGVKDGMEFAQPENLKNNLHFDESNVGDVGLVSKLNNFNFLPISWPVGGLKEGDLLMIDGATVTREMIGDDYKIISEIKYPDNTQTAYWILEKL